MHNRNWILLTSLILINFNCTDQKSNIKPGSIYTVVDGFRFGVFKVLSVDDRSVEVKMYKNRYEKRPDSINIRTLHVGLATGNPRLLMSREEFDNFKPIPVGFENVTKNDFDTTMWKN
jgi:hypothetical protein